MNAFDLWVQLRHMDPESSALLKQTQRSAYREPDPEQNPDAPMFGTPAHCLLGSLPPWPVFSVRKMTLYHVPVAYQMISARRINEQTRAAGELFDRELLRVFRERSLPIPWVTQELHKFGTPRNVFDALAVWVSFVEFDTALTEDEFLLQFQLSPQQIISRILQDSNRASEIAESIAEAIEINFKDEVRA